MMNFAGSSPQDLQHVLIVQTVQGLAGKLYQAATKISRSRLHAVVAANEGDMPHSTHLMMLRQGFSRWRTALSAMMMLSNSSSTSLVPRTRCSTDLAASACPSSTRELGVLGRKTPPSSRMEPGTAASAREMRQPLR